MACVWNHPKSPYFIAQISAPDGTRWNRSTGATNRRPALRIAETWEEWAVKARNGELTQPAAVKLSASLLEGLTGAGFLAYRVRAASDKLLADLMEAGAGDRFHRETIAGMLNGYVTSRKALGRSVATVKRYEAVITSFLNYLPKGRHEAAADTLTTRDLEGWRDAELVAGKGGTTVDFGIHVIGGAIGAARRRGVILHNPAEAVERVGDSAETRDPFTEEQIRDLLKVANDDWKGMVLLGCWCGPRLVDAASATRDQIDLEEEVFTLLPQKTSRKQPKPIAISMSAELVEHFKKLPPAIGKAPLFPTLAGRAAGSHAGLSNEFSRLMESAGVVGRMGREKKGKGRRTRSLSFHSCRHFFVTRLAENSVSADVRKAIAGHSSDAAHERYVHLSLATQRKALEKLPRLAG